MKSKSARAFRREIGELSFSFYVRRVDPDHFWFGRSSICGTSERNSEELSARLIELGYSPFCTGKPGTAGAHIVEVKLSA